MIERSTASLRLVVFLLVWGLPAFGSAGTRAAAGGPATGEPPATGGSERSVTVVAGPEYAAGSFHRLWFGENYRRLWTTPVTVPVVDLATFAGGLTPVRQVGGLQTAGLALAGADGRAYTFRSLHKEPERVLPIEWRDAFPGRIVRDHTSATHPGGALVLTVLAEAAGILQSPLRLVLMPDDPALGQFRKTFAGRLGTLSEFPRAGPGVPAFGDATEIIGTSELWKRWLLGPENRADSRSFLRARVLDLYVENYDRHRGQWRWARLGSQPLWQPIAEDPDMAFIRNEGLAVAAARSRAPKLVRFGPEFPRRLEGPTANGAEMDRWLLTDLDRDAFEAVVRDVQGRFTDEVIAKAAQALPPEWRSLSGDELVEALRARRDHLATYVMHYYRDLAGAVDVHATDRDEVVEVRSLDQDAVLVTVALAGEGHPYYQRRFVPGETGELRIYLHGGDDRVKGSGPAGGRIRVRVIAGDGRDVVDDSASGGTDVWGGTGALEVKEGRRTSLHAAWTNPRPQPEVPWLEPRNFGHWTLASTQVLFATELDFLVGAGLTRSAWGFRSVPEARVDDVSAVWSTGERQGRIRYQGTFRRPGSSLALSLDALGSGIERINFFGYGNETERPPDKSGYRTLERFVSLSPALRLERSGAFELWTGAALRYSDTPTDRPNVLNEIEAYGRGSFGELGLGAGVRYDSRGLNPSSGPIGSEGPATERSRPAAFGLAIDASGFYDPPVWQVEHGFGGLEGELRGYLGRGSGRAQIALRAGGRRVWGRYPWCDAAFLGGAGSLRGYSRNRFAGDASLYGGAELRVWLGALDVPPLPLRVGVTVFGDTGRVWLEGEDSDRWHPGWGVGVMLQPLATPFVLHAAWARGRETTRFYFGSGMFF